MIIDKHYYWKGSVVFGARTFNFYYYLAACRRSELQKQ